MTARDLFREALDIIGVVAMNETVSASDADNCKRALNMMLDQWSVESLVPFYKKNETFTLINGTATYYIGADDHVITDNAGTYTAGNITVTVNGTACTVGYDTNKNTTLTALAACIANTRNDIVSACSYNSTTHKITVNATGLEKFTITPVITGITGTMTMTDAQENTNVFDTQNPAGIEQSFARSSSYDYPVAIIENVEYNNLAYKTLSGRPTKLHYVPAYPLGTLHFYPVPDSGYTVGLTQNYQFVKVQNIDTEIYLPVGYNSAIAWNLAVDLAPRYDKPVSAVMVDKAAKTLGNLKRVNMEIGVLENDFPGSSGGGFDINTGGYN